MSSSKQYKENDLIENYTYKEVADICKSLNIKVQGKKLLLIKKIITKTSPKVSKSSTNNKQIKKEVVKPPKPIVQQKKTTNIIAKPRKSSSKTQTVTTSNTSSTVQEVPSTSNTNSNTAAETSNTQSNVAAETPNTQSNVAAETSNTQSNVAAETSNVSTSQEAEPSQTKDADPDNEVVSIRMAREKCNTGELHASLIWHDIADLDIHVQTSRGEHLYFGNRESVCGGWLDKDMNVQVSRYSEEPIENIFWASAPSGHYKIWVRNFNCHVTSDPRFCDRSRSVPFRVRLIRGTQTDWFEGSVKDGQEVVCFDFNLKGNGAVGSFVVIPPNDVPATFKELAIKNKVEYSQGEGYYAVKRKEEISEKKDMVLHDVNNDTFIIGHADVCLKLNQPVNKRITLRPEDIPSGFRLFVQSTSHNRKIPADTHVLVRVSVREALRFRQASKYNFR